LLIHCASFFFTFPTKAIIINAETMYKEFYGLNEYPFNVTSNPRFFFLSRKHKEAFSHLVYGIREKKGFLEITGEIGTGKTTLCRMLLNQIDKSTKTAFILNPDLSELQLLQSIIEDFGINFMRKTKWDMIKHLNKFLLDELTLGGNVVLIIDEAQNLKPRALEQIRLLSNMETENEKLLQIVLVGQPELRDKLNSPNLAQLRQRITVRYHILPLDEDEISDYINHRLSVAGANGSIIFGTDAVNGIYAYTQGVPRLINLVCDKALLLGYVLEQKNITDEIIQKSINEIEGRIQ